LHVQPLTNAPVDINENYSLNHDTTLTLGAPGVLANDTDADGDGFSAVLVGLPSHGGVILNSNGSFTYSPAPGYNGPDSFTYKANDGLADSGVATVAITGHAGNNAPAAVDDNYTLDEDTTLI